MYMIWFNNITCTMYYYIMQLFEMWNTSFITIFFISKKWVHIKCTHIKKCTHITVMWVHFLLWVHLQHVKSELIRLWTHFYMLKVYPQQKVYLYNSNMSTLFVVGTLYVNPFFVNLIQKFLNIDIMFWTLNIIVNTK